MYFSVSTKIVPFVYLCLFCCRQHSWHVHANLVMRLHTIVLKRAVLNVDQSCSTWNIGLTVAAALLFSSSTVWWPDLIRASCPLYHYCIVAILWDYNRWVHWRLWTRYEPHLTGSLSDHVSAKLTGRSSSGCLQVKTTIGTHNRFYLCCNEG